MVGLEPTRDHSRWLLRPVCLPFHHIRISLKPRHAVDSPYFKSWAINKLLLGPFYYLLGPYKWFGLQIACLTFV